MEKNLKQNNGLDNQRFEKLYQYRIANNLSCSEMAKKLGLCTSFYWQLENKKRRLYYGTAKEIAKIFKKQPDEIFYEDF